MYIACYITSMCTYMYLVGKTLPLNYKNEQNFTYCYIGYVTANQMKTECVKNQKYRKTDGLTD